MSGMGWKRHALLLCGAASIALTGSGIAQAAEAADFSIAAQPLSTALAQFGVQSKQGVFADSALTTAKTTRGVTGDKPVEVALNELLAGTGLGWRREGSAFVIVKASAAPQSGSAAGDGAEVEALIVTAQKREENIQDVPIAMSAFSQEQLERSQVAGGPDLMTQVPNMTFTKTNFSSYSIQLRGIGTQAISATTDPAVAVAFNNTPFIRNRFFEQEFFDLQRVEVLRGPQGTLYGRNATAGVVNVISQKPKFTYESKLSADVSNYSSTRLEGMVNVPLAEDKVALRLAGAWMKREGFVTNEITGNQIDGRDLWSTRLSLRFTPTDALDVNLIWEHFEEDDDRLRSGKQLCHRDARTSLGEGSLYGPQSYTYVGGANWGRVVNQGCLAASLYSPDSFEAPNGYSLPYYHPLESLGLPTVIDLDPYASTTQSRDLRVIESTVDPHYTAESNTVELQVSYQLPADLTLTSETAYNSDELFSTQDYNRFATTRGAFDQARWDSVEQFHREGLLEDGFFCDPQIGCADRVVGVDLSTARSRQFSQEFRLGSDYEGPFNFSLGANFLRYDTVDKYYVFINTLTMYSAISPGAYQRNGVLLGDYDFDVDDNQECLLYGLRAPDTTVAHTLWGCGYIDPNPIGSLNDLGHNYFLSNNPYKLISYAAFGEAYYNIADNLKLTAGVRWTVDKKEAPRVPSWLLAADSVGYPVAEVIRQEWREPTGRLALDWKPALAFTDETLLYASYAHGYKAGGANPPAAGVVGYGIGDTTSGLVTQSATQPKTFDPEFVDAYEIGAKNTLLDGRLTLNLGAFYYDYSGYQISYIVNRAAVNLNFDAEVKGVELEADWRPIEPLRLGLKLGYEDTKAADGSRAIDVMDRTAGNPDWIVVRPFPSFPSNCIVPLDTVAGVNRDPPFPGSLELPSSDLQMGAMGPCEAAYVLNLDPFTNLPYQQNPTLVSSAPGTLGNITPYSGPYQGWNPALDYGNNHGEGFYKDVSENELPNAPHYTATVTADYTLPLPADWLMTLHTDLYYQSEAWTRIFNTEGYDKLKAYTNVNLAAIFTNEDAGWKVMAYVKNVFDRDSITGSFLNSDDTGLTTNVFLTEPRLFGLRVTKEWNGGPWWTGANPNHPAGQPYPLTLELAGMVQRHDAPTEAVRQSQGDLPDFLDAVVGLQNRDLDWGDGRSVRITYRPRSGPWSVSAAARYGRTNSDTARERLNYEVVAHVCAFPSGSYGARDYCDPASPYYTPLAMNYPAKSWSDGSARNSEEHEIIDFQVRRNVGLGSMPVASEFGAGLRYATFQSSTRLSGGAFWIEPLVEGWFYTGVPLVRYRNDLQTEREFTGAGPSISWDAAMHLLGSDEAGHLDVDWSIVGGALFGKQETSLDGEERIARYIGSVFGTPTPVGEPVTIEAPPSRAKDVTVPFLDLSLGLSYEVGRVKLGAGYRWERYFDVIDAGYDEHKDADRTIDGPYFKIAVGFGG